MKFTDLKPGTIFRWKGGSYNMLKLASKSGYVPLNDHFFHLDCSSPADRDVTIVPSCFLESPEYPKDTIEVPIAELATLRKKLEELETLKKRIEELEKGDQ